MAVVPLLTGSGTRLKILEAWAAGLPVVSTTIGAEGLAGARRGNRLAGRRRGGIRRRGNTAVDVHGTEAADLGQAGRLLLEKEFTWETAWKKLDF